MSGNDQNSNQTPPEQGYKELPPAVKTYFKIKNSLKAPVIGRDEQGLSPKRFSKSYFEDTCPYCETTAEHEGKKHRYSKVTRKKIMINMMLMFLVAFATGIGLIHILVGLAVIGVLGYSTATHADRKMYYTLLCRKCGRDFPMDKDEQDAVRQEELEKKATAATLTEETASQEEETSETVEIVSDEDENEE